MHWQNYYGALHFDLPSASQVTCQAGLVIKCPQLEWLVTQSCLILFDPMDSSLPGSSVHGIFQARILEWVAISFSRGTS